MSKITTLDKRALISLRDPIEAALAKLGEELGLKFKVGSGSYGGATGHFKLEIAVDDPEVQTAKKREIWDANCRLIVLDYNRMDETCLRPEDFGTEFHGGKGRYRVTGLALKRQKYPIEVEVLDGPKKGATQLFSTMAIPLIRAATDSAKAKAAA